MLILPESDWSMWVSALFWTSTVVFVVKEKYSRQQQRGCNFQLKKGTLINPEKAMK
jgi:hypothetical protein